MIIPPEVQPHVAALIERCNWLEGKNARLEKRNAEQQQRIEALTARVKQQLSNQRDRYDAEQRRAQRAWQDASRAYP